ncbi:MAG TPA: M48 family metallopeptidase [Caulobacteraceae bacterium]|nr:M48 family metallopeptidase [Caulobacteraceae bacterium]
MALPIRSAAAVLAASALSLSALTACTHNEALGRNQLLLISDAQLAQASSQAWAQTLQKNRLSRDAAMNERVRRIGARIVQAAGLNDRPWEYAVFENASPNAFVLPGGQVGVTTGLFKVVENDDQLAAVIGHEAAHVAARHAAERYSQTAAAQVGLSVVGSGLDSRAAMQALGLGAQVGVLLPFSRQHELEADRIGVDYMHRAGFRPAESLRLWENMARGRTGGSTPQWASTHPSDATRLQALSEYLRSRGWL